MLSPLRLPCVVALVGLTLAWSPVAVADPLVVGHRGTGSASSKNPYPENTVPSIEKAFAEGADLVEIDVRLAKGGVPVLWHDEHAVVGGKKRAVRDLLPAELPEVVGSGGMRAPVPTFRQALAAALAIGSGPRVLDIELKVDGDHDRLPLVAAVAQVLREERAARRVMVSSFDLGALEAMEVELPGIESGLLGVLSGRTLSKAIAANRRGAGLEWVIPSGWFKSIPGLGRPEEAGSEESAFVADAHAAGFKVGVWTLNEAHHIEKFRERGYDMVITDEPDVARSVLPPTFALAALVP